MWGEGKEVRPESFLLDTPSKIKGLELTSVADRRDNSLREHLLDRSCLWHKVPNLDFLNKVATLFPLTVLQRFARPVSAYWAHPYIGSYYPSTVYIYSGRELFQL